MNDLVRRFQDDTGRFWRAVIIQSGAIAFEGNGRPSTSSTLLLCPDDADRPRFEVPLGREIWNARQFTDAELKSQLALAQQIRSGRP